MAVKHLVRCALPLLAVLGVSAEGRNIPLVDEYDGAGKCIITGGPVDRRVVIAKAY